MLDTYLGDPLGIMAVLGMHGVGVTTAEKALARFGTLREMHEAPPEACKGVLNATIAAAFRDLPRLQESFDRAQREVDAAERLQARILTPFDEGYPERLRETYERPLILYAWGDLSCTDRSVAVVGTREPTKFGEVVTERMTGMLTDAGWAIVSGLARGVDHIAHETALAADAKTVAVIGSGLDTLASERQRDLLRRILDAGGAAVTEKAFGYEAEPASLIRRNRIISGLSASTLVMQAKSTSGTMQTVRYAMMQGRPIYAPVPSGRNAEDEVSQGLLMLVNGTGLDVAVALKAAKGSFLDLVTEHYSDRPAASGIAGREDYARVLDELDALVAPREEMAAPFP